MHTFFRIYRRCLRDVFFGLRDQGWSQVECTGDDEFWQPSTSDHQIILAGVASSTTTAKTNESAEFKFVRP